jgi:hypothetical protein
VERAHRCEMDERRLAECQATAATARTICNNHCEADTVVCKQNAAKTKPPEQTCDSRRMTCIKNCENTEQAACGALADALAQCESSAERRIKELELRLEQWEMGEGTFGREGHLRRVVRRRHGAMSACIESRVQAKPDLPMGSLKLSLKVNRSGRRPHVTLKGTLGDTKVQNCIKRVARRMKFEKADSGFNASVVLSYELK